MRMKLTQAAFVFMLACNAVRVPAAEERAAYMTRATTAVQDSGRCYEVNISLHQMESGAPQRELPGIGIVQKFGAAGVTSVRYGTGESLKLETLPVENEPRKVRCLVVFTDPEARTTISEFIVCPGE